MRGNIELTGGSVPPVPSTRLGPMFAISHDSQHPGTDKNVTNPCETCAKIETFQKEKVYTGG